MERASGISSVQAAVQSTEVKRRPRSLLALYGVVAAIAAGLLVYSQIRAFAWDEGYHLLTAQLIRAGKTPYLDFCFPQTPLNAYWNAFWMALFGDTWRTAHVVAALLTSGAILLTADFVFRRFPVRAWRLCGAVVAAIFAFTNPMVVEFGTVGQAYGICLFLLVAAFRISIIAVERESLLFAGCAGILAGAAAGASLLSAGACPVLLVWIWLNNQVGKRTLKGIAFVAGAAIPFIPMAWLYSKGPRQVLFNVFQYHVFYRRVNWDGATRHDLDVVTSWIANPQSLFLGLLAAGGVLYIAKVSWWNRAQRAEFHLALWLACAIGVELCTPHPTFPQYFILIVPFLSILATVGLYAFGTQLIPNRPLVPVLALCLLLCCGLARRFYDDWEAFTWRELEQISSKVDQVTPRGGTIWADEQIYFLTRRPPPSGMELAFSHRLQLPPDLTATLHILPQAELNRQVKAGVYDTIATCDEPEKIQSLDLPRLYRKNAKFEDCVVYWDKAPAR